MMLCVYCSERATVRVQALDWRRFACAKHVPAVVDQAKALEPRRNFTVTRSTGFDDRGRALGARARPVTTTRDPEKTRERRAAEKRRNAPRPLAKSAQASFDALVKARGVTATADALELGQAQVEKLRFGGTARPATVAKVEAALARGVSS